MLKLICLSIFLFVAPACLLYSQDATLWTQHESGILDDNFGTNGIVLLDDNSQGEQKMIMLQDGRIIIGTTTYKPDNCCKFMMQIFCLNPDGTIDDTFGNNGYVNLDISANSNHLFDVEQLSNGNILVIGEDVVTFTNEQIVLLQLDLNGKRLAIYDEDGIYTIDTYNGSFGLDAIKIENGEVLCAGGFEGLYGRRSVLFKLNANGELSTDFGVDGFIYSEPDEGYSYSNIQPLHDNSFIAFETILTDYSTIIKPKKYFASGILDSSFIAAGNSLSENYMQGCFSIHSTLTKDNFIYIYYIDFYKTMIKIDLNGEVVTSFGDNGLIQIREADYYTSASYWNLSSTDQGAPFLIGSYISNYYYRNDIAVTKLTVSGEADSSYSTDGTYYYNIMNPANGGNLSDDYGICMLHVSDSIIYILGGSSILYDKNYYSLSKLSLIQSPEKPKCNLQEIKSVNENLNDGTLNIDITLLNDDYLHFTLFDAAGRPVHDWDLDNLQGPKGQTFELNIPPYLPDGVYFISTESSVCAQTHPVVILH